MGDHSSAIQILIDGWPDDIEVSDAAQVEFDAIRAELARKDAALEIAQSCIDSATTSDPDDRLLMITTLNVIRAALKPKEVKRG